VKIIKHQERVEPWDLAIAESAFQVNACTLDGWFAPENGLYVP
jgi:hypothetical protein